MILVFALLAGVFGTLPAFADDDGIASPPLPAHIKDGVSVVAIFAEAEAQPISGPKDAPENSKPLMIDTVWIYFSDNTFDQYAETPKGFELFSTGVYSFKDGGSFVLDNAGDNGVITIERTQKYSIEERELTEYASSHDYELGTLGFSQLFGPNDGKEVEAVFADDHSVIYKGENGVISSLDAIWIYFSDGSFAEYAFLNGEIVPYGSGTYEFDDAGDFHIPPYEEKYGTISQTWKESLGGFAGETLTFDLGAMGLTCLYEKMDADLSPELPSA